MIASDTAAVLFEVGLLIVALVGFGLAGWHDKRTRQRGDE